MSAPSDQELAAMASRMAAVPGVVGVVLGGSRARGAAVAGSDTDLGIVYEPGLDVEALRGLARDIAGSGAVLTDPGGWGPWVDGGGWLDVGGAPVDWIYRRLDRIRASLQQAQRGEVEWHFQVGHPLGIPGFAYIGELALGRILADPTGELSALRAAAEPYPDALSDALVNGLAEASFLLGGARKGADRGDAVWVGGVLFRVLGLCAHAVHGRAGRWLVNEKGAIAATARLPCAPERFSERATALLGALGSTPSELRAALDAASGLVEEIRTGASGPER